MTVEEGKESTTVVYQEHTPEHPFCGNMACACHRDEQNMQKLAWWFFQGLIAASEIDAIFQGQTI